MSKLSFTTNHPPPRRAAMREKERIKAEISASIRRLKADIAANPDPRELEVSDLEQALSLLDGSMSAAPKRSKTEIIADAAEKFLRENQGWRRATVIYDALSAQGIEIGGQNPKSNLTAHMSASGRFVSDRERGWRLKTDEDADREERSGGGSVWSTGRFPPLFQSCDSVREATPCVVQPHKPPTGWSRLPEKADGPDVCCI